jgi:hypothetical protein
MLSSYHLSLESLVVKEEQIMVDGASGALFHDDGPEWVYTRISESQIRSNDVLFSQDVSNPSIYFCRNNYQFQSKKR